jgi:hypothetical protein
MSNALFVVGEIGGNDYNHPLFSGISLDEVRTFVPDVIRTISLAIHVISLPLFLHSLTSGH